MEHTFYDFCHLTWNIVYRINWKSIWDFNWNSNRIFIWVTVWHFNWIPNWIFSWHGYWYLYRCIFCYTWWGDSWISIGYKSSGTPWVVSGIIDGNTAQYIPRVISGIDVGQKYGHITWVISILTIWCDLRITLKMFPGTDWYFIKMMDSTVTCEIGHNSTRVLWRYLIPLSIDMYFITFHYGSGIKVLTKTIFTFLINYSQHLTVNIKNLHHFSEMCLQSNGF